MTAAGGAAYRATRGARNNNPGNIRYVPTQQWLGQIGHDGAFVKFDTMENGTRALARLLKNYYTKHNAKSIAAIINRWAPPTENNTESYIEAVSLKVGYPSNTDMDAATFADKLPRLVSAIARHENGYNVVPLALAQRGVALA